VTCEIFNIFHRTAWLKPLHIIHLIRETHVDLVSWRGPAIAASTIVILIGLAAVVARRSGLLDIDFTGGTSVQVKFKEPQDLADVRSQASSLPDLEDVAVSAMGE